MKSELEKFRTRWLRWLGQKTRKDKPYWTTLLESNWKGWVLEVMAKCGLGVDSLVWEKPTRELVKLSYLCAIHSADMDDLRKLDILYCDEKVSGR